MRICRACGSGFEVADWRCPVCGHEPRQQDGFRSFSTAAPELEAQDAAQLTRVTLAEANSFWGTGRNRLIAWALSHYFPNAQSFLEIGCGGGNVLSALQAWFPKLTLIGGDPYLPALAHAHRKVPGVELVQLDGRQLPFTEEFDVIGAFDSLEHVEEDEQVLDEMFRAVRPGGGILLTVPQHKWLWSAADTWALHRRRYQRRELISKIEAAGFTPVRITSFVSLILPLMLTARLRQRRIESYDPCYELDLPQPLQRVLGSILALELRAIMAGLSLPAGGSLLVVARRPAN